MSNNELCEHYRTQLLAQVARTSELTATINETVNITPDQIEHMQAECEKSWRYIQSLRAELIKRGLTIPVV